jgi:hypothetical protein
MLSPPKCSVQLAYLRNTNQYLSMAAIHIDGGARGRLRL